MWHKALWQRRIQRVAAGVAGTLKRVTRKWSIAINVIIIMSPGMSISPMVARLWSSKANSSLLSWFWQAPRWTVCYSRTRYSLSIGDVIRARRRQEGLNWALRPLGVSCVLDRCRVFAEDGFFGVKAKAPDMIVDQIQCKILPMDITALFSLNSCTFNPLAFVNRLCTGVLLQPGLATLFEPKKRDWIRAGERQQGLVSSLPGSRCLAVSLSIALFNSWRPKEKAAISPGLHVYIK